MTPVRQPEQPKRLAIILPHLGVGGAQRVAVTLANQWADQGFKIDLITLLDCPEDFYKLSPAIRRYILVRKGGNISSRNMPVGSIIESPKTGQFDKLRSAIEKYVSGRIDTEQNWHTAPDAGGRGRALKQALKSRDIQSSLLLVPLICMNIAKTLVRRIAISVGKMAFEFRAFRPLARAYLSLLRASFWRIKTLRDLLRRLNPDAVVSFLGATSIITIAASRGLRSRTRIVISERNDPARQRLDKPWQDLRPIIYPLADVVTANSHGALKSMEAYCSKAQLAYVPNPIVVSEATNESRTNSILFLGRLVSQKAPDVLVDAFALFAKEYSDWTLQIAGDGPMQNELMDQARAHGISDRIVFHGLVKDPSYLLSRSRIFALPSRFEGTPNALLEAMALRLACVISDASPGPLNLIEHGSSGLVVKTDDPEDMAMALASLVKNPILIEKFGEAARERTNEFRLDNVARDWERLLFGGPVRP